jgi:hypothetical protein
MAPKNKCKMLADRILEILDKGMALSDDVLHYIDSTFFNPSIKELKDILQDDSNCEKDSLLELLFFPDESLQVQLEEFFENKYYKQGDEEKVLNYLCQKPLRVSFHFPEKRGSFGLEIPEAIAYQFIKRLNISKQLDQNLLTAIKNNASNKHKNHFKVRLRNSRFANTSNNVQFLTAFFERIDTESSVVFEYIGFALGFLEEIKEDTNIFNALMAKKKFYLKHLKHTEKFEDHLQKSNIETLMLQGKMAAFIDKNEAKKKMEIIDRISLAVYGKTEYFEPLREREEFIELRSEEDFRNIIKRLK